MPRRWMQPSFSVLAHTSWNWNTSEFFPFKIEGEEKGSFCKSTTLSHQGLVTKLVHVPLLQADAELWTRQISRGEKGSGCPEGCTSPLQWEKPPSNAMPRVRASLPPAPSGWQKGHLMVMGWVLAMSPSYPWMSGSVIPVLVDGSFTWLLSAQLSAPTVERSWRWINIDLVDYVLKLLWSSDSLHHTQPIISSVLNILAHQCYERQELAQQENTILASALCSNLLSWSAPQFCSICGVHRQWVSNRSCCWGSWLGAVCFDAFVFAWDWLHPVCSTEKEKSACDKAKGTGPATAVQRKPRGAFAAFLISPTLTKMVGGTSWQDKKRVYLPNPALHQGALCILAQMVQKTLALSIQVSLFSCRRICSYIWCFSSQQN